MPDYLRTSPKLASSSPLTVPTSSETPSQPSIASPQKSPANRKPPSLPSQLTHVVLNAPNIPQTAVKDLSEKKQIIATRCQMQDEDDALPVPTSHVVLDHLYACSVKDGVMAIATTTRYRDKYITTVFYRPMGLADGITSVDSPSASSLNRSSLS